tara:strand:- start:33 stop:152 length:120 start_codon:yes stop_codon:yes gene_type:complete
MGGAGGGAGGDGGADLQMHCMPFFPSEHFMEGQVWLLLR